MEYIIAGAVILLVAIAIITSFPRSKKENRQELFDLVKRAQDLIEEDHRIHTLETKVDLLLDRLSLEYKIEPPVDAQPVLVKKTKDK